VPDQDLKQNQLYLLGEIAGTVAGLPSRMDRHENNMAMALQNLSNKIDAGRTEMTEAVKPIVQRVTDAEHRLTKLESWRLWVPSGGAGAVMGAIAAALIQHFLK
jgi:hypothetical protein